MRTTQHSSREWGLARHNDRDFDITHADHIDPGKQKENSYLNVYGDKNMTFQEAELKFYTEAFADLLQDMNARAVAARHAERCKTPADLLKSKKTAPEEVIYQIGNKDDTVDPNQLIAVYNEFNAWHRERFGHHIKRLDVALHLDEQTPHVHVRQVWTYRHPAGYLAIGQEKALKQLGYQLPEPGAKESRTNNRKIVYTRECREKWNEICREKGIEIETEPENRAPNKQNLRKNDYIIMQQDEKMKKMDSLLAERQKIIDDMQLLMDRQQEVFEGLKAAIAQAEARKSDLTDQISLKEKALDILELKHVAAVKAEQQDRRTAEQLETEIRIKRENIEQQKEELAEQEESLQDLQNDLQAAKEELERVEDEICTKVPKKALKELIRSVPDKSALSEETRNLIKVVDQLVKKKKPSRFLKM